ncbi:hypothetical protein RQM47_13890 [Rubrivirga sp. S365]|uniref:hypothetical protein n=1 Tax=Rubrivirga sp. S365 TaxID=3076080 RepID=UPI0028CAD85A|nr:hypothetical protein [Rubrivirga sp. S365]MDT7857739.1 hypothetical protein [Rubrivirga sp. S365]
MRFSAAAALVVLLAAPPASAQRAPLAPDFDLVVSGGIQPRASVGVEDAEGDDEVRYGAGLRRARLQVRVLYRDLAGVEYDVDGGAGRVQSVDLFAFVALAEGVQARAGYFPVAQPRGGILTPYFLIDAVDRAVVAERWLAGTVGGDGRDLGVDVTVARGRTLATLTVHNGAGTLNPAAGNVREGISNPDVAGGPETSGLAVSAAASHQVGGGVEVGAFAGLNAAGPERTDRGAGGRSYTTGGAHLYWGAVPGNQPVRLKLDALALRYADDGRGGQSAVGLSALGAVRVLDHGEAFARAERFWADTDADADDYLTAGLSYSPSGALRGPYHRARLTLAYQYRDGAALPDAHLVILQGQLAF